MKHSELIREILNQLDKNGISLHTHREIHNMLLPGENFDYYSSNWSNWLNGKAQRINNANAKRIIQETIGFEGYIWDADDQTQIRTIRQAVQRYLKPIPKVDLSDLLPKNRPLTDAQTEMLIQIRKSTTKQTEEMLDNSPFLKALPENQIFLLRLLELLFEKGMYDYLIEYIYPALLPHNAEQNNVKIFKAHTYGSLKKPEYLKAVSLLNTIETDSDEEILEVKTGLLSNLRRYTLEKESLEKSELLENLAVFRQYYTEIFENIQKHHYYPATNLMYMLKLFMLISPNIPHIDEKDLEQIYQDTKPSITKASHSSSSEIRYFAMISDVECRLILGKNYLCEPLALWLETYQPSTSYVERTLRMMRFFVRMVEEYGVEGSANVCLRFAEVIEILEGYVKHAHR